MLLHLVTKSHENFLWLKHPGFGLQSSPGKQEGIDGYNIV